MENQLLGALEEKVLSQPMLDYAVSRFREELERRATDLRRQQTRSALGSLQGKREELQARAVRIADAIAAAGHSPTLLTRLSAIESELVGIDRQIAAHKPINIDATTEELRNFVMQKTLNLRGLLREDVSQAHTVLAKHIPQLVLTPTETVSGAVFEVSGELHLAAADEYVMPVVARDGIEPPTPAI